MLARNFTYDGVTLESLGYTLCDFGSGDDTRIGSELTFSTVPILKGQKFLLADTKYDNYLTTTLQICKNPCHVSAQEDLVIQPNEVSAMSRWLNKKSFRKMIFNAEGWNDIVFECSFNVSTIEIGGEIFGLQLEMITNRPFATKNTVTKTMTFATGDLSKTLEDNSDEIGFIYPDEMTVVIGANGNFTLTDSFENRTVQVKNCSANEVLTFEYPAISSSIASHNVLNDFNYVFPRVSNMADNRVNTYTANLPCTVTIKYKPIVKITL